MSSVSRNNENDRVRRLREEYEAREAQSEKRKNAELKRVNKKHAEELSEISEAYNNQMDNTRAKSQESAQKTEKRHQDQIYDLSKLHRGQLQKKLEDADEQNTAVKKNAKREIEENNKRNQTQRFDLTAKSKLALSEKDQDFNESFERMSNETQSKFKEQSAKMANLRKQDAENFNNVTSAERQRNFEKVKNQEAGYKDKLAELERSKNKEIARLENKYNDYRQLNESYQSNEFGVRGEMQSIEKDRTKAKYDAKLESFQKESDGINENYRNTLSQRSEKQLASKDSQIKDLRQRSTIDRANQSKLHKLEKENIIRDYEKKLALLNEAHGMEVGQLKEDNIDKKLRQIEESSTIISDANKKFKHELQLNKHINREDRSNLIRDYNDKISATEDRSQKRVDQINTIARQNQEITEQRYAESADKLKKLFDARIEKNRESNLNSNLEVKEQAQTRLREIEKNYSKKLNYIVGQKNDEISKLKRELDRTERLAKENTSQRLKEHFQVNDKEKQTIVDKYERYIDRVKDNYSEEIDRLRERHRKEIVEASNRQAEAIKNLKKG